MNAVDAPARPQPAVRDQLADHLLTPQNAALIVIDYQPSQFAAIRSIDQELLTKNIVSTVKVAQLFGLPIIHSTVNVSTGLQEPTVQPLAELLSGYPRARSSLRVRPWTASSLHQAGAQPVTWVSLAGELQRDWARQETVAGIVEVVLNERLLKE